MTSPPEPVPASDPDERTGPVRIQGPLRRLLIWIVPANISIFVVWGAVPGLLLALQVGAVNPEGEVASLALISALGAACAMIAQPIAGVVSDRTRSRFGRRTPWIVAGSVFGGLALIALGQQTTIVGMAICWMLVQIGYNFAQGPLSAIVPDRVPRRARGRFAAVSGVGLMAGMLGGQFVGASFRDMLPVGYTVLAVVAVVVLLCFCLANPDRSSRDLPREPFALRSFLSTFWVNPIRHPDFFWAFSGRLLLNTGYGVVNGFMLYLLADYIGLGKADAAAVVPLLALTSLIPLLIATAVGGPLSDRFDRRRLFVFLAGALLTVALLVPWIMPTLGGMYVFAVMAGIGMGLFQSVDTALINDVLPSQETYGKDLGVVNIAATLPQTLAPGIAGVIVLGFGYAALFPVGIVLCILGALAVWPIRSVR